MKITYIEIPLWLLIVWLLGIYSALVLIGSIFIKPSCKWCDNVRILDWNVFFPWIVYDMDCRESKDITDNPLECQNFVPFLGLRLIFRIKKGVKSLVSIFRR